MPADHYIMDADMKKVADAIRAKGETTAPLTFPDGMVQAVNGIQAGGYKKKIFAVQQYGTQVYAPLEWPSDSLDMSSVEEIKDYGYFILMEEDGTLSVLPESEKVNVTFDEEYIVLNPSRKITIKGVDHTYFVCKMKYKDYSGDFITINIRPEFD